MSHISEASCIDTARLRLRPMQIEDAGQVHRLWTEGAMLRSVWGGAEVLFEQSVAVIERSVELCEARGAGLWCAFLLEEDLLVGFGGFWFTEDVVDPQLVFGITRSRWQRGLATEMLRALLRHGFEDLAFSRTLVELPHDGIERLLGRLGFSPRRAGADSTAKLAEVTERTFRDDGSRHRLVRAPQPLLRA